MARVVRHQLVEIDVIAFEIAPLRSPPLPSEPVWIDGVDQQNRRVW